MISFIDFSKKFVSSLLSVYGYSKPHYRLKQKEYICIILQAVYTYVLLINIIEIQLKNQIFTSLEFHAKYFVFWKSSKKSIWIFLLVCLFGFLILITCTSRFHKWHYYFLVMRTFIKKKKNCFKEEENNEIRIDRWMWI